MNIIVASFGTFGTPELIIFAILVLVLFSAKKLPMIARSLGRSMGELRRAKGEFERELWKSLDAQETEDNRRHPDGNNTRQNPNALVYLIMLVSAIMLAIGLVGWMGR